MDAALWRAAPANPSACVAVPVDWRAAGKVVVEADARPDLPQPESLAALDGGVLACWYRQSNLYSPLFVAKLARNLPDRDRALEALALWAISQPVAKQAAAPIWRAGPRIAALRSRRAGPRVFSPDSASWAARYRAPPSVADQMPASMTLALITRGRFAMAEAEA